MSDTNINITLTEDQPINITLGEEQPIEVAIDGYTLIAPDHNHDTRYYRKDEIDVFLDQKISGVFDEDYKAFLLEKPE